MSIDKCSAPRGLVWAVLVGGLVVAQPEAHATEAIGLEPAGELALPAAVDAPATIRIVDGSVGDVVVVTTTGGDVWVLDADTGTTRGPWSGFDGPVRLNLGRVLIGADADGGIRARALAAPENASLDQTPLERWWPRDESAFDANADALAWRTDDGAIYALDLVDSSVDEVYAPASVVIGRRTIELPTADRLVVSEGALTVHAIDGEQWTLRPDTTALPDVYASDGSLFAATLGASARESDVEVWDVAARTRVRELPHDAALVQSIALDAEGRRIAIAQVNAVDVWDLDEGARQLHLETESAPNAVALTPDGVITGHVDGSLMRWGGDGTLRGETRLPERVCARQCRVERLVTSLDGQQLVAVTRARTAAIYELRDGADDDPTPDLQATFRLDPVRLALSGDGRRLIVASDDGESVTFDRDARTVVSAIPARYGSVTHIWPSHAGRYAVLGHRSGAYSLWQLDGALEIAPIESHRPPSTQTISFAPGGRAVAFVRTDGSVSLLDPTTGLGLLDVDAPGAGDTALSLSWSEDGARFLVLSGDVVRLYDVTTSVPKLLASVETPEAHAATLGPDGSWVAVAHRDRVQFFRVPGVSADQSARAGCACVTVRGNPAVPPSSLWLASLVGFLLVWNRRAVARG